MFELTPWRRREKESFPTLFRSRLFREFDDLVDLFFRKEPFLSESMQTFHPDIDISETDENFIVKGEIPGIEPENLDVSLSGQVLTIKGEKKEEKEDKQEGIHTKERRFGSFSRSFSIPCEIQEGKIEAHFENGVLTLTLPKAEVAKKKPIQIEVKK
jgi:HSP20 family protein